jgi:hypothetical protein
MKEGTVKRAIGFGQLEESPHRHPFTAADTADPASYRVYDQAPPRIRARADACCVEWIQIGEVASSLRAGRGVKLEDRY